MAAPDFALAIGWGLAWDAWEGSWWTTGAGNIVLGTNPPYALADLMTFYPKFLGTPSSGTAGLQAGSTTVVLAAAVAGLAAGQLIIGAGIQSNTTITAVAADNVTLTLSQAATATGVAAAVQVYVASLVPMVVLNAFIALASAALAQQRWQNNWQFAMALYVAHYATLWLQTEGLPGQAPQQMALAAVQRGIGVLTSKSADGVSASYQPVSTAAAWGSFGLSAYGVQLVGMARLVGMGGMYIQG